MHGLLRRLEVKNFTSLKNLVLDLENFNVLVGLNASGKSNIIRVLNFLKLALEKPAFLGNVTEEMGYKRLRDLFFGQDPSQEISIKLVGDLNGKEFVYKVNFLEDGVKEESFTMEGKKIFNRNYTDLSIFNSKGIPKEKLSVPHKDAFISYFLDSFEGKYYKYLNAFVNYVSNWAFYSFNPEAIRGTSNISPSLRLERDGGNLPQVLHTLLTTKRKTFTRIEEILKNMCTGGGGNSYTHC